MRRGTSAILALLLVVAIVVGVAADLTRSTASKGPGAALASNSVLDPGTALSRPAPNFTLTDQFGQRVSLRSSRGRVVILAFNDSECTTVCPLTTTAMVDAKEMLGAAGARVELLGIDANPNATSIEDVRAYSRVHGMLHQWRFLTASLTQLKHVWKQYGIAVQIDRGQIDHTPALFVIDPRGRLARLYLTQMSYASIPQLGQLLAQEASSLLPGRPAVKSSLSYAQVPAIAPSTPIRLPRAGGGTVRLGPAGGVAHLQVFFASWVSQTFDLSAQLATLDRYQSAAAATHLPGVIAVDEGSVEPSARALSRFLRGLHRALAYPVAIDRSGRVADGYEVEDQPWFVLTSRTGRILWNYDASTQGPLTVAALTSDVRAALSASPKAATPTAAAVPAMLAGSPGPLAALHVQAGRLLGSEAALAARLRTLRGYPVVINVWASWCPPCKAEFPVFASVSAHFGRQVAFLGVDTNDVSGDAMAFLAKHPISYPSYQSTSSQLSGLAGIEGLPTTIFINREGKVVSVHTGPYYAAGTLSQDIEQNVLGG